MHLLCCCYCWFVVFVIIFVFSIVVVIIIVVSLIICEERSISQKRVFVCTYYFPEGNNYNCFEHFLCKIIRANENVFLWFSLRTPNTIVVVIIVIVVVIYYHYYYCCCRLSRFPIKRMNSVTNSNLRLLLLPLLFLYFIIIIIIVDCRSGASQSQRTGGVRGTGPQQ